MKEVISDQYRTDVEFCDRPDLMVTYFNTKKDAMHHLNTWSEGQKSYSVESVVVYKIKSNQSNVISKWCNRDCCPEY